MTLVVNLVRTVSSAKFVCCFCRNPWCDCRVTYKPKCNESTKKIQIINCGVTILIVSVFLVPFTNYDTAGAVDKMVDMFTQRIWQPYICQPNELKREIKKKLGWPNGGTSKNLGGHGPPNPPLESPLTPRGWWHHPNLKKVGINILPSCTHKQKNDIQNWKCFFDSKLLDLRNP